MISRKETLRNLPQQKQNISFLFRKIALRRKTKWSNVMKQLKCDL